MKAMKKITIIILAAIALIFMTCKKHSVVNVQQLMLSDENIEVAGSHATLTAKFSYPSTLQSIKMVVSETDDMTNAVETNATIDGDHLQVVVNNLWANTTYYYCLCYANKVSLADTEVKSFTTSDATLPTVETESVSEITMTSAKVGGNVTDTGGAPITERGVCYGTNHNPDLSGSHIADEGGATNVFSVSITELTANTEYYARVYAINKVGTVYGEEKAFVTVEGGGLPTVTTRQITNIAQTTATAGGTVNADGGSTVTARGVCWSTVQNPTVADSHTTDGTGIGSFTSEITELTASTTYYVRAYATNNNGTAYGDNVSFVTQSSIIVPTGASNGLFTINENDDKVFFSKGNLQYQASTNIWRFADNQWDYVGSEVVEGELELGGTVSGSSNHLIAEDYDGWIDLFGWGTSGYNHGATVYQPYGVTASVWDYLAYGSETANLFDMTGQADWGYNAISNGGNTQQMWRTLTNNEWEYVFLYRNTVSGIRNAAGTVNNVTGIIILPDDWDNNVWTINNPNVNENSSYNDNVISAEDWTNILEYRGAVFLPIHGARQETTIYHDEFGSQYYWSSTCDGLWGARCLIYNEKSVGTDWFHRWWGFAVSLIQDYR